MIKLEENHYILGIDIGTYSTAISYIESEKNSPILLDMSGGYKEAAIPTMLQYIKSESDWLIGHHVIDNMDVMDSVIIDNLIEMITLRQAVVIETIAYNYDQLMCILVNQICDHLKQINPKAVIEAVGIVLPKEALEAFEGKSLDGLNTTSYYFVSPFESMASFLKANEAFKVDASIKVMDYGYSGITTYTLINEDKTLFLDDQVYNKSLGCGEILNNLEQLLITLLLEASNRTTVEPEDTISVKRIIRQYIIWVNQKFEDKKPLKVFFSHTYPPCKNVITLDMMTSLLGSHIDQFYQLDFSGPMSLIGGGFKMPWTNNKDNEGHKRDYYAASYGGSYEAYNRHILKEKTTIKQVVEKSYNYGVLTQEGMVPLLIQEAASEKVMLPIILTRTEKEPYEISIVKWFEEETSECFKQLTIEDQSEHKIKRIGVLLTINSEGLIELTIEPLPL